MRLIATWPRRTYILLKSDWRGLYAIPELGLGLGIGLGLTLTLTLTLTIT